MAPQIVNTRRLIGSSAKTKLCLKQAHAVQILFVIIVSQHVLASEQPDRAAAAAASARSISATTNRLGTFYQNATESDSLDGQQSSDDLAQSSSSPRGQAVSETPSTSPSITSLHQVWTSASSGSLDELSPEIIGKLRSDVPFLAAYALRPRLVGGLLSQNGKQMLVQTGEKHLSEYQEPDMDNRVSAALKINGNTDSGAGLMLETGASSPQRTTSASDESLVPKLGDFSEFKVETSSTSKSEHHHKRKTSLKRKGDEDLRMKKRVLAEASQLVKRRQRKSNSKSRLADNKRFLSRTKKASKQRKNKSSVATSKSKRKSTLLRRASRLRTKLNRRNLQHHMNIIRHGRYFQEPAIGSNNVGGERELPPPQPTKGSDSVDGVKGGSGKKAAGRKPFYSKALPPKSGDKPEAQDVDNEDTEPEMTTPREPASGGRGEEADGNDIEGEGKRINTDEEEDAAEEDFELDRLPEPKRVGDGDVDEEGDTVTVMPKSDGVDDDPDIPNILDYEDEGAAQSPGNEPATETSDGEQQSRRESESGDEPRADRKNRERPDNRQPASGSRNDEDDKEEQDGQQEGPSSTVGGSGIGATVGGSGGNGPDNQEDASPNDQSADTGSGNGDGGATSTGGKVQPGVEFANNEPSDDGARKSTVNTDRKEDREFKSSDDEERGEEKPDLFESRKRKEEAGGRKKADEAGVETSHRNDGDATSGEPEDERKVSPKPMSDMSDMPDVDYRDDTDEPAGRKRSKDDGNLGRSNDDKKHKSPECDDGSYDHHHDHHHDHHNSIKWLQDAIPGEPNQDYPILSRANVTNFSCMDQKYPGYYADVEARCQVFHICQADGRQDSFLCPNGTIFSQKTYVCVWWNSFNCEDAPKYYDLNALLYKSTNNKHRGTADLRPLDGEPISSPRRAQTNVDDEESSIDSLIRNMQRNKANTDSLDDINATNEGISKTSLGGDGNSRRPMNNGIGPDDEATIQRKSTNVEDEQSPTSSSRLRASKAEPRRKRRASVKQAPPKLKSRRLLSRSRKYKLRHGIKPRRRA